VHVARLSLRYRADIVSCALPLRAVQPGIDVPAPQLWSNLEEQQEQHCIVHLHSTVATNAAAGNNMQLNQVGSPVMTGNDNTHINGNNEASS
jgi:hypothetical protein